MKTVFQIPYFKLSADEEELVRMKMNNRVSGALRRAWKMDPIRNIILGKARVEGPRFNKDGSISKRIKVTYTCAKCSDNVPGTEVHIDHIEPVGKQPVWPPNPKLKDWNEYLYRLFTQDISNLQVLCKSCHKVKTREDNRATKAKG